MPRPVLLEPAFTAPSRTPWGGQRIAARKGLTVPWSIGESWELSLDGELASRTPDGMPLLDLVGRPDGGYYRQPGELDLLVKWLDADDDLSVQIHPDDGHPSLAPDECGKPEAWYVVEARHDAAIHLGLAADVTDEGLARALAEGRTEGLLHRVAVEPGDFFLLEPGIPHAVGRGVFVVEPQRVRVGRKGVTYRFHDWGRRYDESGRTSPSGSLRPLHVREALAVTDFDGPRGEALLQRVRLRSRSPDLDAPLGVERFTGEGGVTSRHLYVARVAGRGEAPFRPGRFSAVTVLEGTLELTDGSGRLTVPAGRSAAVPATFEGAMHGDGVHALIASILASDGVPE